jgi:hypothetical protein
MRLAWVSACAFVLLAAGCATVTPPAPRDVGRPAPGLAPDCLGTDPAVPGGVCVHLLGLEGERNREASLATHPTDPQTVLVTWRVGEFSGGPRIAAAVTRDGGAHWEVTELRNPAVPDLGVPGAERYAYDSIAGFGPDGTAYVLYGGEYRYLQEPPAYVFPEFRMTLARSADGGATWTYHTFADLPTSTFGPDYPDMAIAPDSGRITVAAQMYGFPTVLAGPACSLAPCVAPEGIWTWSSSDGGATWDGPVIAIANPPTFGIGVPFHYLPRLEAGPGGFVLLSTNAVGGPDFGGYITRSEDGGATWGTPQLVHAYKGGTGSAINSPAAVWTEDGATQAALVYGDGDRVVGYRSQDGGATWGTATLLATYAKGTSHFWMRADARGATVWAEARYGSNDPDRFLASAYAWSPGGAVWEDALVDVPVPGAYEGAGDDYAAFAVAADGSAWAGWSDLRSGDAEKIAIAHVALVEG